MSSTFLYLGIVGIWAFVLVPRWLRRQHSHPQVAVDVDVEVEFAADYETEPQGHEYYDDDSRLGDPGTDASAIQEPVRAARYSAVPRIRSRVLRARRRLLTMLVLLTAVAGACTGLKLTSWWACIPPAGMLGLYLLLLREAALADAEQARWRAAMELRVQAARQRAYASALDEMERQAQPSAQIIDISARVGDQLYDQYADATLHAVGD